MRKQYLASIPNKAIALSRGWRKGDMLTIQGQVRYLVSWNNGSQTLEASASPDAPLTQTFAYWQVDQPKPAEKAATGTPSEIAGAVVKGKRGAKSAREALTPSRDLDTQ